MPTVLFSLYNKTGLIDFARPLHALGWDFLASGGTAKGCGRAPAASGLRRHRRSGGARPTG